MFTRIACTAVFFLSVTGACFGQVHSILKPGRSLPNEGAFEGINQRSDGKIIMGLNSTRMVGFDAESGKEIFAYPVPKGFFANRNWEVLRGDGKTIFVGDGKKILALDGANGAVKFEIVDGGIAVVPTRGNIVAAYHYQEVYLNLYDAAKGKKISQFKFPCKQVHHFALAPDGKTIAFIAEDDKVMLCNLHTAEERGTSTRVGRPLCLAFSDDGRFIAVGGHLRDPFRNGVFVLSADTLKPIKAVEAPGDVWDVAISPKGEWVAGVTGGSYPFLSEVKSGEVKGKLLGSYTQRVFFSQDSTKVLSTCRDAQIMRWDIADAVRTITPKWQIKQEASNLAIHPEGKIVVVSSAAALDFRDIDAGKHLDRVVRKSDGRLEYFSFPTFSPDGRHVAALLQYGELVVYDRQNKRFVDLKDGGGLNISAPPQFSPDGKKLLLYGRAQGNGKAPAFLGDSDKNFCLDTTTWKAHAFGPDKKEFQRAPFRMFKDQEVGSIGFAQYNLKTNEITTPDGDFPSSRFELIHKSMSDNYLAGSPGIGFVVWDLAKDKVGDRFVAFNQTGYGPGVVDFDISADDRLCAIAGDDQQVWLWELKTGRLLARLPHVGPVEHARFTPDGRALITADRMRSSDSGYLYRWDLSSWSQPAQATPKATP